VQPLPQSRCTHASLKLSPPPFRQSSLRARKLQFLQTILYLLANLHPLLQLLQHCSLQLHPRGSWDCPPRLSPAPVEVSRHHNVQSQLPLLQTDQLETHCNISRIMQQQQLDPKCCHLQLQLILRLPASCSSSHCRVSPVLQSDSSRSDCMRQTLSCIDTRSRSRSSSGSS
jgi:hypothetical protein